MSDPTPQPTKADRLRAYVAALEDALKMAAGGLDERVVAELDKIKAELAPATQG
jgi:hypothetical protein